MRRNINERKWKNGQSRKCQCQSQRVHGNNDGGYVIPFDFEDDIANIPGDELHKPLLDRNPLIECQFNIDLNKIEVLISGLTGRELLSSDVTG